MALRKHNKKTIGSKSKRKFGESNAADGIAKNIGRFRFRLDENLFSMYRMFIWVYLCLFDLIIIVIAII